MNNIHLSPHELHLQVNSAAWVQDVILCGTASGINFCTCILFVLGRDFFAASYCLVTIEEAHDFRAFDDLWQAFLREQKSDSPVLLRFIISCKQCIDLSAMEFDLMMSRMACTLLQQKYTPQFCPNLVSAAELRVGSQNVTMIDLDHYQISYVNQSLQGTSSLDCTCFLDHISYSQGTTSQSS